MENGTEKIFESGIKKIKLDKKMDSSEMEKLLSKVEAEK